MKKVTYLSNPSPDLYQVKVEGRNYEMFLKVGYKVKRAAKGYNDDQIGEVLGFHPETFGKVHVSWGQGRCTDPKKTWVQWYTIVALP